MRKKDIIARYGKAWYECHINEQVRNWRKTNPNKTKANNHEANRKGGKYYQRTLLYNATGLRAERRKVRKRDWRRFRKFKRFFAQESQIHHQWIPGTAEHTGIALVEKDKHIHGIIDVILLLDGEISLLTE